MFAYGLSRKQCGVIFAAEKRGDLNLAEGFDRWMYARISDSKVFRDDSITVDVFNKMKKGLDLVFSKDFASAEKQLNSAFDSWHVHFKEC